MAATTSTSTIETRFKALVEIRDMASNWDIDISEHLEAYMEEMLRAARSSSIEPSQLLNSQTALNFSQNEGDSSSMMSQGAAMESVLGRPNINFAEAALLIQGSTSVYSKKVEYLYQLVMRSAEMARPTNGNKQSTTHDVSKYMRANGARPNNKAIFNEVIDEEKYLFGADPTYLLLDDFIVESAQEDICLKEDPEAVHRRRLSRRSSTRHSSIGDVSRSSAAMLQSVLQDESGGGVRLKITSSAVDQTGTLLLNGLHNNLAVAMSNSSNNNSNNIHSNYNYSNNYYNDDNQMMSEDNYASNDLFYDDGGHDDVDTNFANIDAELGDGRNSGDFSLPNNRPFTPRASLGTHASNPLETSRLSHISGLVKDVHSAGNEETAAAEEEAAAMDDIDRANPRLLLLDPHSITSDSKALQKKRCFQIPKILLEKDKKDNSTVMRNEKEIMAYDLRVFWSDLNPYSNLPNLDLNSLLLRKSKTTLNSAFHPLVETLAKQRYKSTLKDNSISNKSTFPSKNKHKISSDEIADEDYLYVDAADDQVRFREQQDPNQVGQIAERENDTTITTSNVINTNLFAGGGEEEGNFDINARRIAQYDENWTADCGYDENNEDGYGYDGGFDGNNSSVIGDFQISNANAIMSEEEELSARLERVLNESLYLDKQGKSKLDSLEFADSYESLCRRHIEKFTKGAEQYAKETQLSRRVNEWTGRLENILAEQDANRAFDIYEYSNEVLQNAKSIIDDRTTATDSEVDGHEAGSMSRGDNEDGHETGNVLKFDDIADGQRRPDVCRYFLSCLQLANFGNIELITSENGSNPGLLSVGDFDGTFQFKLITTDRTRMVM